VKKLMVQIADKTPLENVTVVDSRETSDQHGPVQMQETPGSFYHVLKDYCKSLVD